MKSKIFCLLGLLLITSCSLDIIIDEENYTDEEPVVIVEPSTKNGLIYPEDMMPYLSEVSVTARVPHESIEISCTIDSIKLCRAYTASNIYEDGTVVPKDIAETLLFPVAEEWNYIYCPQDMEYVPIMNNIYCIPQGVGPVYMDVYYTIYHYGWLLVQDMAELNFIGEWEKEKTYTYHIDFQINATPISFGVDVNEW